MDHLVAGQHADEIIAGEVSRQDKMWGVANERADSSKGQLLNAAVSQSIALIYRREGHTDSFTDGKPEFYPADWSGFRDYGSDVANLAVAAAFIRQEMKRLIASGASVERIPRNPTTQPYTGDQPAVQL